MKVQLLKLVFIGVIVNVSGSFGTFMSEICLHIEISFIKDYQYKTCIDLWFYSNSWIKT